MAIFVLCLFISLVFACSIISRQRHVIVVVSEPVTSSRGDNGVDFYAKVAADAGNARVELAPCKVCGRKFARERLDKHMAVCKDATKKKRKVFDPVKMRTDGTELAQYQGRARRASPKPKVSGSSRISTALCSKPCSVSCRDLCTQITISTMYSYILWSMCKTCRNVVHVEMLQK